MSGRTSLIRRSSNDALLHLAALFVIPYMVALTGETHGWALSNCKQNIAAQGDNESCLSRSWSVHRIDEDVNQALAASGLVESVDKNIWKPAQLDSRDLKLGAQQANPFQTFRLSAFEIPRGCSSKSPPARFSYKAAAIRSKPSACEQQSISGLQKQRSQGARGSPWLQKEFRF